MLNLNNFLTTRKSALFLVLATLVLVLVGSVAAATTSTVDEGTSDLPREPLLDVLSIGSKRTGIMWGSIGLGSACFFFLLHTVKKGVDVIFFIVTGAIAAGSLGPVLYRMIVCHQLQTAYVASVTLMVPLGLSSVTYLILNHVIGKLYIRPGDRFYTLLMDTVPPPPGNDSPQVIAENKQATDALTTAMDVISKKKSIDVKDVQVVIDCLEKLKISTEKLLLNSRSENYTTVRNSVNEIFKLMEEAHKLLDNKQHKVLNGLRQWAIHGLETLKSQEPAADPIEEVITYLTGTKLGSKHNIEVLKKYMNFFSLVQKEIHILLEKSEKPGYPMEQSPEPQKESPPMQQPMTGSVELLKQGGGLMETKGSIFAAKAPEAKKKYTVEDLKEILDEASLKMVDHLFTTYSIPEKSKGSKEKSNQINQFEKYPMNELEIICKAFQLFIEKCPKDKQEAFRYLYELASAAMYKKKGGEEGEDNPYNQKQQGEMEQPNKLRIDKKGLENLKLGKMKQGTGGAFVKEDSDYPKGQSSFLFSNLSTPGTKIESTAYEPDDYHPGSENVGSTQGGTHGEFFYEPSHPPSPQSTTSKSTSTNYPLSDDSE